MKKKNNVNREVKETSAIKSANNSFNPKMENDESNILRNALIECEKYIRYRFTYLTSQEREDIVQDATIKTYMTFKNTEMLKNEDEFVKYAIVASRNAAFDFIKSQKREFLVRNSCEVMSQLYDEAIIEQDSLHNKNLEKMSILINDFLDSSNPIVRSIFRLRFNEGKRLNKIAAKLDLNYGTVRTILSRSLRKIRIMFERNDIDS